MSPCSSASRCGRISLSTKSRTASRIILCSSDHLYMPGMVGVTADMALPDHLQALAASVSNRGRWGAADRRGTLNLIDPAAVLRGIAAVRTGTAFSLAIPFDEDGPQDGMIPGRTNPAREMVAVNLS